MDLNLVRLILGILVMGGLLLLSILTDMSFMCAAI